MTRLTQTGPPTGVLKLAGKPVYEGKIRKIDPKLSDVQEVLKQVLAAGKYTLTENDRRNLAECMSVYQTFLTRILNMEDVSQHLYDLEKRVRRIGKYAGTPIVTETLMQWLGTLFAQLCPRG